MQSRIGILLLVAILSLVAVEGYLNEDAALRHPSLQNKIPQVTTLTSRHNFEPLSTGPPSKFQTQSEACSANATYAPICFTGRDELFSTAAATNMLILRLEFSDLPFSQADRNFNYRDWYITTKADGTSGVLGSYLNLNSRGLFAVSVVDVETTVYTAAFTHASLLQELNAEMVRNPGPDSVRRQKYFNAVSNEVVRQYLHVSGQSVVVYNIWAIHIPAGGEYDIATVGKGLALSGAANVPWRDTTTAWGGIIGMLSGGALRLSDPVLGAAYGAIVRGDSISGMAGSNYTRPDMTGHWPMHEKLRVGWLSLGHSVVQVNTTSIVKLYAHNTYQAGASISTTPGDGFLGIKVGPYSNTWFVSYNDMPCLGNGVPCLAQGATLYFKTPVPGVPYLLKNVDNSVDFCPHCMDGYDCGYCTNMEHTVVKVGANVDFGYFNLETKSAGVDTSGNKYIEVEITFSTSQLCPQPGHYGAACDHVCWGGAAKCGGGSHGTCSDGPTGNGQCTCNTAGGWVGLGCDEDDYCDVDMIASKNPVAAMESYMTGDMAAKEVISDFNHFGRVGYLDRIRVSGSFEGVGVHAPSNVTIRLYKGNLTTGEPIQMVMDTTVYDKWDAAISVGTSMTYDSVDLIIKLKPDSALAKLTLEPDTYWISVMPNLLPGQRWVVDAMASNLQSGAPDWQRVGSGPWTRPKNFFNSTQILTTSARVQVDMNKATCVEYFECFPRMKPLIIRIQYPDLHMSAADANFDYDGAFAQNGFFAHQLDQSSQGHCTLDWHPTDNARYYVTPVLTSANNFSDLVIANKLTDPTYRDTLFNTLKEDALITVRASGTDPDYYDVHFGFYPAFGDSAVLQRTYPSIKGIWSVGPSTLPNPVPNTMITAFGFVLGLQMHWFQRPVLDPYLQDSIRIPNGASLDAMGWSWLAPNFAVTKNATVDWNVHDRVKLGWITEDLGLLKLNRTQGKISFKLHAMNNAVLGAYKAVHITEPGVAHGWWLQYFDSEPSVINVGASLIFSDDDGRDIYIDATPGTDNCPGCMTGLEPECRVCNMRDTSIPQLGSYNTGYFRVDVALMATDNKGPYLPITITFSDVEKCPLRGHFGSACNLQCPGGAMDTCNGLAQCDTGLTGTGQCGCVGQGTACELTNDCALSYASSRMLHAKARDDMYMLSYSSGTPGTSLEKSIGPAADFETTRPAHLKSITFWGRSAMSPTSNEIYKPRMPQVVKVVIYNNNATTNTPGKVRDIKYVTRPAFIKMEAGQQLLSTMTKITVSFDPHQDVNRFTLWPGKYWVQVLVEDPVLYEIVMDSGAQMGNFPDVFFDYSDTLGLGLNTTWTPTTAMAAHMPHLSGATHLEVKYVLEFDSCLPSYQYVGIPLPRPEVTNYDFIDFFPKKAMEGEVLNITFRGYIPYGCGQTAMVKIANTRAGYGCWGEAPGGSPRPLVDNKHVIFKVDVPGVYSVCIKPQYDLDWEEIGREDLVVYNFRQEWNYHGFSSCQALIAFNNSVCGCTYEQVGAGQTNMVLPMDFPFNYMTVGSSPIMVRQGCCTFITDKMETFDFVDANGNPTANKWGVCMNIPE